jgi:hypothetical protein
MLRMLLEARDMTEELLHTLLRLWTLPTANEHNRARIKCVAALARFRDSLATKATLILEIIGVDLGHTI